MLVPRKPRERVLLNNRMAPQTPAKTFDLAALGGVVEPQKQEFNLAALGGVVEPQPQSQDSTLARGAKAVARGTKSLGSGLAGGTADLISMPYNLAATMFNALKESKLAKDLDPASRAMLEAEGFYLGESGSPDIPTVPSAVDAVDHGVDSITGGYTQTPENEKSIHEGLKAVGSMASVGGAAKGAVKLGANKIGNVLEKFGSTKARDLAAGGFSSGVTSEALERGQNLPVAFGEGIGAGVVAQSILKNAFKLPTKLAGFGKDSLKLDAIESSKNLGVDLPNIAATSAKLPNFGYNLLAKAPFLGDELKNNMQTASTQFQKAWGAMLDSVGAPKTEELSKEVSAAYASVKKAIPKDAAVMPSPMLNAIAEIEQELQSTFHAEPTKKLFTIMKDIKEALVPKVKLPEGFEKYPKAVQDQILTELKKDITVAPIPVKVLLRQKVELNKAMRDKNIFDRTDTDSLGWLKKIQGATNETLEEYGKQNPKFFKELKQADEKFARTAKREDLDDLLSGKIHDPHTGEVAYTPLVKILKDRDRQKFLKNKLGDSNYEKLEDFVNVAQAMDAVQRNNPNKSGTAVVTATIGFVQYLAGANPTPAILAGLGAYGTTKLLTNKRFLNLATKFAKEPTEPLAQKLNALVKESTGMTSQALMTGLKGNGDAEDKKLKIRMYDPDNPPLK